MFETFRAIFKINWLGFLALATLFGVLSLSILSFLLLIQHLFLIPMDSIFIKVVGFLSLVPMAISLLFIYIAILLLFITFFKFLFQVFQVFFAAIKEDKNDKNDN